MKRNALQLLRLTGKRCVCLGLCVACLFLGGCRAAEEAASDPGAQTDGQAQSVESSEALGTDTPDFAGHGMTMSREEYFSRERYVNWCQSLTCASGSGYGRTVYFPTAQLVLTEAGGVEYKKAAIYEVPAEIQGNISAFLPANMFFIIRWAMTFTRCSTRKALTAKHKRSFLQKSLFSPGFCPITACSSAMNLRRFRRRWHGSMRLVWMSRCRSNTIGMCWISAAARCSGCPTGKIIRL